ncbi:MAG: DUF2218 domain-containing protein [Nevskiaceae bacterium]|jgi:hypothetical protein|nr:DUF2218 domain-containing protein [Nevskiaceae bacterium]
MSTINGEAATTEASRAIRRLCRHWSHKFQVQFDDSLGVIHLTDAKVTLHATPDRIHILLENPAGEVPPRLMGVVAEHLQRMLGAEAVLDVKWSPPTQ